MIIRKEAQRVRVRDNVRCGNGTPENRHIIANDLAPDTVLTVDEIGGKLVVR